MDNLIVFIKNPALGHVKTRLAATVGDRAVLDFYHRLLGYTRSVALAVNTERWLFYSNYVDKTDSWPETGFNKQLQEGRNLGEKMANSVAEASSWKTMNEPSAFVIIGSDCAQLTPEILNDAFSALKENDFTIGPALDGGYYLIGMTRPHRSVFEGIEWSSGSVFGKTMEKIAELGASVHVLPPLPDIDTEADWLLHARHLH